MKYTEKDIQDYLDGRFAGNKAELEFFLPQDADAQKTVQQYQQMYATLKKEEFPSLSFDLAGVVVAAAESKQRKKASTFAKLSLACVIILGVVAVYILLRYLGVERFTWPSDPMFVVIMLAVSTAFLIAHNFIEVQVMKRRFNI